MPTKGIGIVGMLGRVLDFSRGLQDDSGLTALITTILGQALRIWIKRPKTCGSFVQDPSSRLIGTRLHILPLSLHLSLQIVHGLE